MNEAMIERFEAKKHRDLEMENAELRGRVQGLLDTIAILKGDDGFIADRESDRKQDAQQAMIDERHYSEQ